MFNAAKEHRLTHYTVATIKKQQELAGVAPTIGFTGQASTAAPRAPVPAYSQPTVGLNQVTGPYAVSDAGLTQANADQTAYYTQHGSNDPAIEANIVNLTNRLKAIQANPGVDPASGIQDPTQIAQIMAAKAEEAYAIQQRLDAEMKKRQDAGKNAAMSGAASAAATAGANKAGVNGNRFQGPGDAAVDRQAFIEAQRATGKTDAQIRQMINTLPPEQTGGVPKAQPEATGPTTGTPTTSTTTEPPKTGTDSSKPAAKDGTAQAQAPAADPLDALIAGTMDPQLKAVLMAMKAENALENTDPAMGQDEFANSADAKAIAKPFDAIDRIVANATTRLQTGEAAMKDFLTKQFERNDKFLAQQEENQKNQLQFANDKAVRDQLDANKKRLDSETIMLALQGGFGSTDGNREIAEARFKGEQAIIDLNKEFGFKRTDVSLAFTQMHNESSDKYQTDWLAATDNFESRISNLDLQGITNQQAKSNAIGSAYQAYVDDIKTARKEKAARDTKAAELVYNAHLAELDDRRAKDQSVINQAQWAVSTYGSGAKPFIEKLAKDNPGVDLAGLMGGQTLNEANQNFDNQLALMKEGRIGGSRGGGGLSFSPSQMGPTGQPISLEQFIAQKEADSNKSGSPQQRAAWTKEYNATRAETSKLDPSSIVNDFKIKEAKAGTFTSVAQQKAAEKSVQSAINSGDFETARKIVDGIGRPPPEKTAARVSNLQRLTVSLAEMDQLLDSIETNVGPFPTQGPMWTFINEHVETSPEYQRMLTLKNTNLAPYSRSVSGESGASSEGDVARAISGLLQANVSAPAMRAALAESKKQAEMAITMYLRSMRDSGYAVNDLQNTYDAGAWQNQPSGLPTEQQAWLDSL